MKNKAWIWIVSGIIIGVIIHYILFWLILTELARELTKDPPDKEQICINMVNKEFALSLNATNCSLLADYSPILRDMYFVFCFEISEDCQTALMEAMWQQGFTNNESDAEGIISYVRYPLESTFELIEAERTVLTDLADFLETEQCLYQLKYTSEYTPDYSLVALDFANGKLYYMKVTF